ncbi:Photosynthetic reaction center cytochrome C subunit [Bryocella elongata]|uniref:Photosynthetic reaction center cytochrome c subunit n=1 Tax=Bryocella elongata TaxID=863522 RepID=A0A1H5Z4F1_9BACT|nr:c-type cytochrome [Bryocella elongata]SEG31142.1 Photosynthetic reaction center cytochrome C subunit [Bryocella elongata]
MKSSNAGFVWAGLAFAAALAAVKAPGAVVYGAQSAAAAESTVRNLKVLPKDISPVELNRLMLQYKQGLGVPCGYCHAETQEGRPDYASDENPIKETARVMIGMTRDINETYLAKVGDRRYADPITCGNCHQGLPHPPVFTPKAQ